MDDVAGSTGAVSMSRSVQVLKQANDDLLSAMRFYESQQTGLGQRCVKSLLDDVESLAYSSGVHPKRYGLYLKIAKIFPFGIYYDLSDDVVRVFAVLDNRQSIEKIMDKIKQVKNTYLRRV